MFWSHIACAPKRAAFGHAGAKSKSKSRTVTGVVNLAEAPLGGITDWKRGGGGSSLHAVGQLAKHCRAQLCVVGLMLKFVQFAVGR